MALSHSDLFFVNRDASTYKIEAIELGEYLLTNPLPDGSGYIINDGEFSIKNTNNVDFKGPYLLTSANTANNTAIDFDENFTVDKAGNGADVTVAINFAEFKANFLCDYRTDTCSTPSGFATDNCDCLALDFDFISNKLPCPDSGIVDDNGCLQLNYCDDGLLTIRNKQDGCLDVKVCNNAGIDTNAGCIAVDMDFITQNIACNDSGLTQNGGCLAVDYDKVLSTIGLHNIISTDSSVTFRGGNKDLTVADVNLSVDWSKNPYNNTGDGNPPPTICVNEPLYEAGNGCIGLNPEPDVCAPLGIITSTRLTNKIAGNPNNPGITIGIATEDGPEKGNFIGFCGAPKEHRLRLVGLDGWDPNDACSPSRATGKHDMAYYMRDNVADDGDAEGADHKDEKRTYKNSCIPNVVESGRPMIYRNSADRVKAVANVPYNPFLDPNDIVPVETGVESDQAFDVDNIFDTLAGIGNTELTAPTESTIKWERISDTYLGENNEDYGGNPQPYTPTLRADRLAQVHPALAEYAWSSDSFEAYPFSDDDPDDTDTWGGRRLKSNPDDRTRVAVKPNEHTLIILLMAANRRQKARIADLESSVANLESRLTAAGIP